MMHKQCRHVLQQGLKLLGVHLAYTHMFQTIRTKAFIEVLEHNKATATAQCAVHISLLILPHLCYLFSAGFFECSLPLNCLGNRRPFQPERVGHYSAGRDRIGKKLYLIRDRPPLLLRQLLPLPLTAAPVPSSWSATFQGRRTAKPGSAF